MSCLLASLTVVTANDFRFRGENLLGAERVLSELKPSNSKGRLRSGEDGGLILQSSKKGGNATFSIPLAEEKGAEYLFRVRVKSKDALVARLGTLSMAYNDLGQWQTVCGLYRPASPSSSTLELELRALDPDRAATAEVRDFSLIRVERPTSIGRRPFSGETDIVKGGEPNAAIIIPGGDEGYTRLAVSIRDAVKAKTGVALSIVTDREATEEEYPVLKSRFRTSNLILLGRLGNNRAIWTAYNRFLTAVDGYYPGGNGYVVHTAANVFHNGANHLIIGGTQDAGVKRGVVKFLERVAAAEPGGDRLTLPWLLETDLQGECLDFFKKDDAKWRESPESPLLPKPEPGYGNVVRWYWNAMGYYWTGWKSYKERAERCLSQVIAENAYTHHYIAEFFVRVYDMLDESGVLQSDQIRAVDTLLLQNFFDVMTVGELHWMTTFAPPYGQINLASRHQIDPWMSDWKFAEFITDILAPEGGLKELAEFRRTEKEKALTDFVMNRNNPSLPGGSLDECYDEINAALFRFALERDLYREFVGSGNALKALSLERINHRTGKIAYPAGVRDTKLLLGITASLTRDPELRWLWKHLPEVVNERGYFQSRYLGGVRRYTPDSGIAESVPKRRLGIQFAPNPTGNSKVQTSQDRYYFVSVRGGFQPGDDYLAFNGVDGPAPSGALVSLVSKGTVWMEIKGRSGDGRFRANTATAIRTDDPKSGQGETASRCLWNADLPSGQALRFRQRLSPEIEWTRDCVRLRDGLFVFRDEFTARTERSYLLGVNWNPNGIRSGDGSLFLAGGNKLRIWTEGDGFRPIIPVENDRMARSQVLRRLRKDESVVAYTVIEATRNNATPFQTVIREGANRLVIGEGKNLTRLDWGQSNLGADQASLRITTPSHTGIYVPDGDGQRSFVLDGTEPDAPTGSSENNQENLARSHDDAALLIPCLDVADRWKVAWRYTGFLKPARLEETKVSEGVIDLGTVVPLAEIRVASPAPIPQEILLSTDNKQWAPATGERRWRPGVRIANYGEMHPVPRRNEALLFSTPASARYVKASDSSALEFFSSSRLKGRHPLRLEAGDFLGTGEHQILVASDLFPQFPRSFDRDDLSVALLDAQGQPIFEKDIFGPVQAIRLLDRDGDGKKELFVLYANGVLETYTLDGKPGPRADLYKMHADFAAKHGDRKTRAPAGGYALPFSIGLWRPDADGHRRIAIGRYGGFTFLNPDLTFEGLLNFKGYGTPGLLAEGVDFGRGRQEQVAVERARFLQLGGSEKSAVRDPGGTRFWEESYEVLKSILENDGPSLPLAGMPILRYELLPGLSREPRFLLLARGATFTLYDGRKQASHYQWHSQAPLRGVAVLEQSEARLRLLVATADHLLWEFDWNNGMERPPSVHGRLSPFPITFIAEAGEGIALLAGPQGVYRFTEAGKMEQIAKGAFVSAALVSEKSNIVAAATTSGEVVAFANSEKSQRAEKQTE